MTTTQKTKYDFPVELRNLFTQDELPKSQYLPISRKKAVVRLDNHSVIGIVSDKYTLLKHSTVVNGFRKALSKFKYQENIQLAKNGAVMFACYKIPTVKVEVMKGDIVSLQLIVKNSYDGSNSLQIMLGAYRLVCSNGMVVGKHFINFSQKHIGNGNEIKIEKLIEKVNSSMQNFKDTLPSMQAMSRKQIRGTVLESTIKGIPNYLMKEAQTKFQEEKDHTVWGVYNALTYAITHKMRKPNVTMSVHYGKVAWKSTQLLLK